MRWFWWTLGVGGALGACSSYEGSVPQDDLGGGTARSSSGTSEPAPGDAGDSSGAPDASACTPRCEGHLLIACAGERIACPNACVEGEQGAQCTAWDPYGPATAADLEVGEAAVPLEIGLDDFSPVELNLDNGEIVQWLFTGTDTPAERVVVRHPNQIADADQQLDGVWFRVEEGRAIFRARSFRLAGRVQWKGKRPLTLIAGEGIQVSGHFRMPCGLGGDAAQNGAPGSAHPMALFWTGAGGGHAATGGKGALGNGVTSDDPNAVPLPGAAVDWAPETLRGGGAGGLGGGAAANGGGALQLIAKSSIDVGAVLDVGGCGGFAMGTGVRFVGGGGAGGTLVLEAPELRGGAAGALAANGGAAGALAGTVALPGSHASFTASAAPVPSIANPSCRGCGGHRDHPEGYPGGVVAGGWSVGGGGGVGHIVLRSRARALQFDSQFVVTPQAIARSLDE